MARYTLTKNHAEIAETYGVLQNVSGNADIEITNHINEAGIILKPLQTVLINQKVFARKIGNAGGVCSLAVLPFQRLCENPTAVPPKRCGDDTNTDSENGDSDDDNSNTNFDDYEDLLLNDKPPRGKPHFESPPVSVQETPTHYVVNVSKESLKNQNKFLVQFDHKKKG